MQYRTLINDFFAIGSGKVFISTLHPFHDSMEMEAFKDSGYHCRRFLSVRHGQTYHTF